MKVLLLSLLFICNLSAQILFFYDDEVEIEPNGKTPINGWVQYIMNVELIENEADRIFNDTPNWVTDNGNWQLSNEAWWSPLVSLDPFFIASTSLGDYSSETIYPTDNLTLYFDVWSSTPDNLVIQIWDFSESIEQSGWDSYSTELFIEDRMSPPPIGFSFRGADGQEVAIDNISFILIRPTDIYSVELLTEPSTVYQGETELTRGTFPDLEEGEWDWVDDVLYINVGGEPEGIEYE